MNTQNKAQMLAYWYQELADNDNGFEFNGPTSFPPECPTLSSDLSYWEINPPKPKKQIIDLNMMIDSDIDMEFFTRNPEEDLYISKLVKIENGVYFSTMPSHVKWLHCCRIRENHWHVWRGNNDCPIPAGLKGEILLKNNRTYTLDFATRWWHNNKDTDIIAFKITGVQSTHRYEWQKEEK